MRTASRPFAALIALLISAAPATTQQVASRNGNPRMIVDYAEITSAHQTNVYDLLRGHRPLWLHTRGASSTSGADVMVYLDGNRLGGMAEMRGIPTSIVTEIRHMDAREATTRWGAGHGNGAIMISTAPIGTPPMHGTASVPSAAGIR